MTIAPKFEPLEDRIVLDAEPHVEISGPPVVDIGEQDVEFTIEFSNTGDTAGYKPYIDLYIDTTGPDGVYPGDTPETAYDGATFDNATYLGTPVESEVLTFDENGQVTHPYAIDASGNPLVIEGEPGDTLVVLTPPYGSFQPDNEPIEIVVTLDFSELMDIDKTLDITVDAGFAYGQDGLDNPDDDPPITGNTDTTTVGFQLFDIDKFNNAPENEAATGPSYPYTWTYTVDLAEGQTLTDFTLTDVLPHEIVYLGNLNAAGGTVISQPGVGDVVDANNDELVIFFDTISSDVTISFDFYINEISSDTLAPVLNPESGDSASITNTVTGEGTWVPVDTRDDQTLATDSDVDTIEAISIAVQKRNDPVDDLDPVGPSAGDVYQFTVNFQVSDYFTYGNIVVTDTLGDGWILLEPGDAGYAPPMIVTVEGSESLSAEIPSQFITVEPELDGSGQPTGRQIMTFDMSAALEFLGDDGFLTGQDALGPLTPNSQQTRVTITYRARIAESYSGPVTGDPAISQGDRIENDVVVTADVLDNDDPDPDNPMGTQSDESDSEVRFVEGQLVGKSIYAINGDTGAAATDPIAPGDEVTFSIIYDYPIGAAENFKLTDILPSDVFDAAEVTDFREINIGIPGAGQAQFGPQDQFDDFSQGVPTIVHTSGNGVEFGFENLTVEPPRAVRIEILFTVTVKDTILAPDLRMTNQLIASETNTFGEEVTQQAIARVDYAEPVLNITKGVIAADPDDTNEEYVGSRGPAGVTFADAGTTGDVFTGAITSDGLASGPIDANLINADAGDDVRFAITIENTGEAPAGAFDIVIKDTVPPGFDPASLANLVVTDGNGVPIGFDVLPGGFFDGGIQLHDSVDQGAIAAYDPTSGANIVIVSYDLTIEQNVTPIQTLENTATLVSYAAFDDGIDRADPDLTDSATVNIEGSSITKTVTANEHDVGTLDQVIVGEEFTFTVEVQIPEGFAEEVFFTDEILGGNYKLINATIATMGGNITSSEGLVQGSTANAAADGQSISFNFGTMENIGDNDETNDVLVFVVTAQVTDADGAVAGDVLSDRASMSSLSGGSISADASVTVIEPQLIIDKTASTGGVGAGEVALQLDAGDIVTYTVEITNPDTANGAPAYDLVLTDNLLAEDLTLVAGSVVVEVRDVDGNVIPGAATVVSGNTPGDTGIVIEIPELDEGQSVTVTYDATVSVSVGAGVEIPNTAGLTYDSMEEDGDPDERDYTASDDAVIVVSVPDTTKVVTETSNPDTPDNLPGGIPDVAIGEQVTFEITIEVPEGVTNGLVLTDFLPMGPNGELLGYISSQVVSVGGSIIGSNLDVGEAGVFDDAAGTVTFNFGNLVNTPDNVSDAGDQIVVQIVAWVVDDAENNDGDFLTNSGTVTFLDETGNTQTATTDTATVAVVEPALNVSKTPDPITGDAGDEITYTVTSFNYGDAPAYDVVIDDDLADIGLEAVIGTPTITVTDAGGADVTPAGATVAFDPVTGALHATIPVLMPGEKITITYVATITDAAEFAGSVDNTVVVTEYSSEPGEDLNERTYDASLPGYTPPQDTASVVTPGIGVTKEITSTDNPDTGEVGGVEQVAIGEQVTYTITLDIPEGTDTLRLEDAIPEGMVLVSATVTDLGNVQGGNLAEGAELGDPNITFTSGILTFNFGTVTNPGDNDPNNDQIVITVVTRVADAAANVDGTALPNTATASVLDPDGNPRESFTDDATVTVVEPVLDVNKATDVPAGETRDAGDTITYTVRSTNTGSAPAYDVVIDDDLADAGLEASGTPEIRILDAGGNEVIPSEPPTVSFSGGALQATVPVLLPGQTVEITYQATITDAAEFNGSVDNTVVVTRYDSDPGEGEADEREYVGPEASASVQTPDLDFSKTLIDTDFDETTGNTVAVGEEITYELVIDLPEGSGNLRLEDVLPEGLIAVRAEVVEMNLATSTLINEGDTDTSSAAITIGANGGFVFDFGSVTNVSDNDPTNDQIVIHVVARVEDIASVADGTILTNTATLSLLDDGGSTISTYTDDETVTVAEPVLDLDKATPTTVADAGDVVTYTVTSTNSGTAPAYDVVIEDDLADTGLAPSGTPIVQVLNEDGTVDTAASAASSAVFSASGLRVDVPVLLAGQTIEITYDAVLTDEAKFSDQVENTAVLSHYDTDPADGAADEGRSYDDTAEDTVTIDTPDVTFEKEVFDTSIAQTPGTSVNVGERVTYELTINVPQGSGNLTLTDLMPEGLEAESAIIFSMGGTTSDNIGEGDTDSSAFITIGANGDSVTFDFGTLTAPGTDDGAATGATIVIRVVALVEDIPAVADGVELVNEATLEIDDPDDPSVPLQDDITDNASVTVVEPDLTMTKDGPDVVGPGDEVDYTLTIENTGTSSAFDVRISDPLGNEYLSLTDLNSVTVTVDGVPVPDVDLQANGDGFTLTIPEIPAGSTAVITYTAVLDADAPSAQNFINEATGIYDTVPDGDPETDEGRQGNIIAAHQTSSAPFIVKEVTDSGFAETGADQHDPDLTDLNIGETVTYTLTAYLPEEQMDSVVITDLLEDGLVFVSADWSFGDDLEPSGAPVVTVNGQTVTLDFGSINNPFDLTQLGLDDAITITIVARVADIPGNTDGNVLTNQANVDVTVGGEALPTVSDTVDVEVVEPELDIEKTGPVAALPGDVLDYELTITNQGTGPAYDVVVSDPLGDPDLSLVPGSVTVTVNGAPATATITETGSGFSLTLDAPVAVLPGDVVVVTYQAQLDADATEGFTYENIATVDYDSADGESVDDRDARDSDVHVLLTNGNITKTAVNTNLSETGRGEHNPLLLDLNIGEQVTYDLVLTMPEYSMDRVVVVDTLDPGLEYVSASVVDVGGNISGAENVTITVSGQQIIIRFTDIDNAADRSIDADDQITIQITARVSNIDTNVDGTVLTNSAALTITPEGEAALETRTDDANIEVVEPELVIDKQGPAAAEAGDIVDYTVTIENVGTGPAYEVAVSDVLSNPNTSLVIGSVTVEIDGVPVQARITPDGDGFQLNISQAVKPGSILTIHYQAVVSDDILPGETVTNTAKVEYESAPDRLDLPEGGARPGQTSDDAEFEAPGLIKAITSTGFGETGLGQHDPLTRDLAIGETVTYRIALLLPEVGRFTSVILTDQLDPGLEYVSARFVSQGADITGADSVIITQSNGRIIFDFGNDVRHPFDPDDTFLTGIVTVEVVARVADIPSNNDGDVLANTATLEMRALGEDLAPLVASRDIEIVEPDLTIDKTGPAAANPGDVIDYKVTLTNQGTGPAYDVRLTDALDDPYLSYIPGSVKVTVDGSPVMGTVTATGDGFVLTLPNAILPGQSVVVTYQAQFDGDAPFVENRDNTATVDYDSAPGETVPDRDYSGSDDHVFGTNGLISKTVTDTGLPETGADQHDPSLVDLNVGETVGYDIVLTLPEISMDSVVVIDTLDPGLVFVSGSIIRIGSDISGAEDGSVSGSGRFITISFADLVNMADGDIDAGDQITIHIIARVADVSAATDGAVLRNTAEMTITPQNGRPLDPVVAFADVEVVEPKVTVEKTVDDPQPMVGDTITYTLNISNTNGTGPAYNLVLTDVLPAGLTLTGNITLSPPSLGTIVEGDVNGETRLIISIPLLMPGQVLTVQFDAFVGYDAPVIDDLLNTATIDGSTTPDGGGGREFETDDDETINVDPVPDTPDSDRRRTFGSEIDDSYFVPILTIDPIFTGLAQPGSNVTLALYNELGGLDGVRSIIAGPAGGWIVSFPRVEIEPIGDDFEQFRDDGIFEAPVHMLDDRVYRGADIDSEARRVAIGNEARSGYFTVAIDQDRPGILPDQIDRIPARIFYAPATSDGSFGRGNVLDVDKVFENVAAHSVKSLYDSAVDPLGPGLNRFNYEFMNTATAVPGSVQ